jgi:hypothetical protein
MIGWPLSPACAVACRFGDESQQPIFLHQPLMRRQWRTLAVDFPGSTSGIAPDLTGERVFV